MVKNFTIMGERASGTNYLEELVLISFNIDVTWKYGWKHFFGHYEFNGSKEEDETLFIGIIRHPVEWINSFFKSQHHILNKPLPLDKFLFEPIISVNDDKILIKEDNNYLTKKPYKNIFELRFLENYYLINTMPNNVKNYVLIQYEFLRDNPITILEMFERKFNLLRKQPIFENIKEYMSCNKQKENKFKKKELIINSRQITIILLNVNKIQGNKLGYKI